MPFTLSATYTPEFAFRFQLDVALLGDNSTTETTMKGTTDATDPLFASVRYDGRLVTERQSISQKMPKVIISCWL